MFEKQKEELKKSAERKAKREAKRLDLPWGSKTQEASKGKKDISVPKIKHKRKPKQASSRRQAFNRLGANCRKYVLLRAKTRSGHCEVGIACGGFGPIEVWYHITPQAKGNALKYDDRNILGSCNWCNAGEYSARKSPSLGSDVIWYARHRQILGSKIFEELQSLQGRRQISTVEANELADEYKKKIEVLNER